MVIGAILVKLVLRHSCELVLSKKLLSFDVPLKCLYVTACDRV